MFYILSSRATLRLTAAAAPDEIAADNFSRSSKERILPRTPPLAVFIPRLKEKRDFHSFSSTFFFFPLASWLYLIATGGFHQWRPTEFFS